MVKFRLPQAASPMIVRFISVALTICGPRAQRGAYDVRGSTFKIFTKFESIQFDENSHRNRINSAQKPHFIANADFRTFW